MTPDLLRFGLIGAARIAPGAMIAPAKEVARAEVVGVAARDPERAKAFAQLHELPTVWATYDGLLEDDSINAVYIGLPPSHHHEWAIKALNAGKHVLCEKPFSATRQEAVDMVAVAQRTGMVLAEAFHWRYHPLITRLREVLDAETIGDLQRVESEFSATINDRSDIRYSLALAGGGFMDLGVYALQWNRYVAGQEPEIVSAVAIEAPDAAGIDVEMDVEVVYPSGITGHIRSSMQPEEFVGHLRVIGKAGTIDVVNPVLPHHGHQLKVTLADGSETTEVMVGEDNKSTYYYQLTAFVAHVLDGGPFPTTGNEIINQMAAVEEIYRRAGLPSRRV